MDKPQKIWNPTMAISGLAIGISVAVLAYFLAPELIALLRDFLADQGKMTVGEFNGKLGIGSDEQIKGSMVHYAFAVLLWLGIFGIMMTIVAMAIGEDPDREAWTVHPREGDVKGLKKYAKELERQHKKRQQLIEKKMREKKKR